MLQHTSHIFAIIGQIGTSAFHLDLPPSMLIHPVFHVSLLEPHVPNKFSGRIVATPPPLHVSGFPVVLDSKIRRCKLYSFVDWVGYDISKISWEPAVNLTNAQSAIVDFHARFPSKPRYLV